MRRFLQKQIETRLARELIAGGIPEGSTVVFDRAGDRLEMRTETPGE